MALGGLSLAAVLGRIGGPEMLGMFTVMLSLLGALGMLARRGQGSLLTRAVAWAMHQDGPASALTLLVLAVQRVVVASLLLGSVGSVLLWSGMFGEPYPGSIIALPFVLLMVTVLSVVAGYARGSGRQWLAPVFEMGGISLVTVALLILLMAWGRPSSTIVLGIFLLAMLVLAGFSGILVRFDLPNGTKVLPPTDEQRGELHRGQIEFTLIAVAGFLIQSGSFLLAAPFLSEADMGLLRAAERLALLVSFPVLAIMPVFAPRIVCLARTGDHIGLKRVTTVAMMMCGGIGAPVLLVMMYWPELALTLIGAEFVTAGNYLRVMALAQFVAALLGPLAVILNLSGRETVSMWINLGTLAYALAVIPLLSVAYGAPGFAFAYSSVIIMRMVLIGVTSVFGTALRQRDKTVQK